VTKAYTTRVGAGPFPTELLDEVGKAIGKRGDEFGATTGRARRCGWFDAVAVSYACRVNGIDRLVMTKPDVLDGLPEIPVCTEYYYKGSRLDGFPTEPWILEKIEPRLKTMPGWKTPVHEIREWGDLPPAFLDYVKFLEDRVEARFVIVSTGVERRDTIFHEERLGGLLALDKIRAAV
jgi:adenylosuccinate synthase